MLLIRDALPLEMIIADRWMRKNTAQPFSRAQRLLLRNHPILDTTAIIIAVSELGGLQGGR